jgi:hypothetical protein
MMATGERLKLVSFYPETQKVENIRRSHRSAGGLKTFPNDSVCKRCAETITAGTPLIWIRGKGTFHKDNPCQATV